MKAPIVKKVHPLIPEGVHRAVCVWIVDIGTHLIKYEKESKPTRQWVFGFEIPDIRIDFEHDGVTENKPRMISQTFTASVHKKSKLAAMLKDWRGREFTDAERNEFDTANVIGKPCTLWITHKDKKDGDKYASIMTIKPPDKTNPARPEIPLVHWSVDDGTHVPDTLPKWIQEQITSSLEYHAQLNPPPDFPLPGDYDNQGSDLPPPGTDSSSGELIGDDIPF